MDFILIWLALAFRLVMRPLERLARAMAAPLRSAVVCLLLLVLCSVAHAVSWYNTSWLYRLPVTVDNSANAFGVSYNRQAISITGAAYTALHAHAKGDYSDLRVTDSDGTTLLSFWLEDTTVANTVMLLVKVPQIAASTTRIIYVYYGNSGASSVSSATGTILSSNIPPLNSVPSVTIDGSAGFSGPAALGIASNGNLLCLYTSGASDNNGADGGIYCKISTDNGATWAARSTVLAPSAGTTACIIVTRITKMASGTLLAAITNDTNAKGAAATANAFILKSTDNGATWTKGTSIPTPAGMTEGLGFGKILEISAGGDLWWNWQALRTGDTKLSNFVMKCASGNDPMTGTNWGFLGGTLAAATVMRDAAQVLSYNECDMVQLSSTNFLAVSREETNGVLKISTSTNTGSTWTTTPASLVDMTGQSTGLGVSPTLEMLANGDIMLTWAERNAQNTALGVGASISTDGGTTWTQMAMTYKTTTGKDTGYGSSIQLPNGNFYSAIPFGNAGGGGSTASTLYGFTWDEDWACNPFALYDSLASSSAWILGAQATRDAAFGHSNTDSLKLDNNAGTTAKANLVLVGAGGGYYPKAIAVNWWHYIDQNNNQGIYTELKDASSLNDTGGRILNAQFAASSPFPDKWFNGSVYSDWTTPLTIASGAWNKKKLKGKTTSNSAATAGLTFNNVLAGTNATQAANGTINAIDYAYFAAGSSGSTNPVKLHIDDIYTTPWFANDPVASVGSETSLGIKVRRGFGSRTGTRTIQ